VPFFREDESKEESGDDQKAHGNDDQRQSSYSTSERGITDSQNTRKPLVADYRVDLSPPHPRADIPLSSTNCNNGEKEDEHVGTFERVAQVRWNGAHRQDRQRGEDSSDETDLSGSVRGKSGEAGNTEAVEESVARVEET